jgi:hypothetical protein
MKIIEELKIHKYWTNTLKAFFEEFLLSFCSDDTSIETFYLLNCQSQVFLQMMSEKNNFLNHLESDKN